MLSHPIRIPRRQTSPPHRRRTPTELFALPPGTDQLDTGAESAGWNDAFATWHAAGSIVGHEIDGMSTGRPRPAWTVGNLSARDHIWVVCDGHAVNGARISWAIIEALVGTRLSRYRQLLLGRARVTVVLPDYESALPSGQGVPLLHATLPAADAGLLSAWEEAPPTVVVHVQDWGDGNRGTAASGRLIEHFMIDADTHRLLGEGMLLQRRWTGQRSAGARAIRAHPDARIGDLAAVAVTRSGYNLRDWPASRTRRELTGTVRIATGRFVPTWTWRRLGCAALGEIALARFGAHAFTTQTFDGTAPARVGTALAMAEGIILNRLGLAAP